jgi:hypothetical protein
MAQKPNTLSPSRMDGHNYVVQLEPPERNDEQATYGVYDTRSRCILTGFSAEPGEGEADRWCQDLASGAISEEELPLLIKGIKGEQHAAHLPEPPDALWYRQVLADLLLLDSWVKSIATLLSEIHHLPLPAVGAMVGWSDLVDVYNLEGYAVEVTWPARLQQIRLVPLRYLWEEGWESKERQNQEESDRIRRLQEQSERTRQEAKDRAEFERLRTKYGW